MKSYAFFWGCTIPARFAFQEKAVRLVAERMELDIVDIDGFTCCPEKELVKSMGDELWLLTAARNLAVAEASGLPELVTPCNGCYGTLKSAQAELKKDPATRAAINEKLAEIGLTYTGKIEVLHLLELFHDRLSPAKIATYVKRPLKGMKIGVHYGCHMMRPAHVLKFDDPIKPVKFEALVKVLGAKTLDYSTKMLCCGGGLSNVGNASEGQDLVRRKLQELKSLEADALTTVCPSCYSQYDMQQFMMARSGEKYNIPVISYQELLALAMGFSPEEIGMDMHKVDTSAFLGKREKNLDQHLRAKAGLDIPSIERCVACGACMNDCPVTLNVEGVNLHSMMKRVLTEDLSELVKDPDVWRCVECHTCVELCPQCYGMEKVFHKLKQLAIGQGCAQPVTQKAMEMFNQTGKLGEPSKSQRKKLGLKDAPKTGAEDWKKLIKK
jgi:CoB--CoM heterodisulfide reductase subunit B